jgi:hypothetical protein
MPAASVELCGLDRAPLATLVLVVANDAAPIVRTGVVERIYKPEAVNPLLAFLAGAP